MVAPFPDKPSHKAFVAFKKVVICLKVAAAVAHCVRILAQQDGVCVLLVVIKCFKRFNGRIHMRINVQKRLYVGIICIFVVGHFLRNALVLQNSGIIIAAYKFRLFFYVFAPARFVSERPDNNRGIVFKSVHHSVRPVKNCPFKHGIVVYRFKIVGVISAVALHIRLGNHIKSKLVA